jgi:hypothetical protein
MALLGKAAVLIWNDVIDSEHDAFYRWHDKEHIPERLALPGFLRGRRYRGSGVTEWLTIYEAADLDVLTSPAYLARLNDPTPATRRTVQAFRNTARSICRIVRSAGESSGGHVLTMLVPEHFGFDRLAHAVAQDSGVLAAHLFAADEAASHIDTNESRERAFVVPKRVLLVETSTLAAAQHAREWIAAGLADDVRNGFDAQSGVFTLEISRLPTHHH